MGQEELRSRFPLLALKYKWAVVYHDGQMDDFRVALESILTSTIDDYVQGFKGSNCLNYTKVKELIVDDSGKVEGAVLFDKASGEELRVKCKAVVNATGIHADALRRMVDPLAKRRVIPSRGTHVSVPSTFCPRDFGLLIPKTSDGRVMFVLPWQDATMVGTTDDQVKEAVQHPYPEKNGKGIFEFF